MKKQTGHDVNRRLQEAERKDRLVNPEDYVNMRTKVSFCCAQGHTYSARPDRVVNAGSGCPHCAGVAPRSAEWVNRQIAPRCIHMDETTFHGMLHKAIFHCTLCSYAWTTVPNNTVNDRTSCPCCASHGFKTDKPATVYLMRFTINGHEFLKYGITNSPKSRYARHRLQGMQEVLLEKHFEAGTDAKLLEDRIKQQFGGRYVSKDILPNGHTETLPPHVSEEVMLYLESIIYRTEC